MITTTEHPHVERNDQILGGEPIIKGTRTSVRTIVETWRLGMPIEEIPIHLPHLNMAQIFDALSYFSDHMDEITGYIEKNRVADHELYRPRAR